MPLNTPRVVEVSLVGLRAPHRGNANWIRVGNLSSANAHLEIAHDSPALGCWVASGPNGEGACPLWYGDLIDLVPDTDTIYVAPLSDDPDTEFGEAAFTECQRVRLAFHSTPPHRALLLPRLYRAPSWNIAGTSGGAAAVERWNLCRLPAPGWQAVRAAAKWTQGGATVTAALELYGEVASALAATESYPSYYETYKEHLIKSIPLTTGAYADDVIAIADAAAALNDAGQFADYIRLDLVLQDAGVASQYSANIQLSARRG